MRAYGTEKKSDVKRNREKRIINFYEHFFSIIFHARINLVSLELMYFLYVLYMLHL